MPDKRLIGLTITVAIACQPLFSTPSAISCRMPLPPFMPAVPTIYAACFHFSVPVFSSRILSASHQHPPHLIQRHKAIPKR